MSTHANPGTTLQARLETAQRELDRLKREINRSTRLTAVIGAVLLLFLCGYFYYGSRLFAEVTEPKSLVNYCSVMIDENLPATRQALEKEIIKSAPIWAVDLSREFIKSVPDGRKKLEEHLLERLDASILEAHLVAEGEFRKFLKKQRPLVERRLKQIAEDASFADAVLEETVTAMEEELQTDLRNDAAELLKALKDANEGLRRMLKNEKLSRDEELERRVWMIVRRFQIDGELLPLPKQLK